MSNMIWKMLTSREMHFKMFQKKFMSRWMKPQYTMLGEYWAMMGAGHVQDWEHRPGGGVAVTQHAHPAATAPLPQTQGLQRPQQLQPGYGGLFKQDNIKMSVISGDYFFKQKWNIAYSDCRGVLLDGKCAICTSISPWFRRYSSRHPLR